MGAAPPYRVLVVCLGNICRSPMAEWVLRDRLVAAGLGDRVVVGSRGTSDEHEGQGAHRGTVDVLHRRGHGTDHRARQVTRTDLAEAQLVLALDRANERDLRRLARTDDERAKVRLLRSFDPALPDAATAEVPDPWGRPAAAFEAVYDQIDAACGGLVAWLEAEAIPAWERSR
jgi:protein-tyrosine phosphatase